MRKNEKTAPYCAVLPTIFILFYKKYGATFYMLPRLFGMVKRGFYALSVIELFDIRVAESVLVVIAAR